MPKALKPATLLAVGCAAAQIVEAVAALAIDRDRNDGDA